MTQTLPGNAGDQAAEFDGAILDASVSDSRTQAMWVHKDLVQVRKDWELGPPKADEKFGDVESFAAYVKQYCGPDGNPDFPPFLTWSSAGLRAVLDYHEHPTAAGRMQWFATMPFERSPEWTAWLAIATGHGIPQAKAIEFLEDHSPDITSPDTATLLAILGTLRATVNKSATTELRPDGTASVSWSSAQNVAARGGTVDLPAEFQITIPVLKGHDIRYQLAVRLRASVDNDARLSLRLSIPLAERALEAVFLDRVTAARDLLGSGFQVLRAAG